MIQDRQQSIDIIRRTHQIFCGLRGSEIQLLYDNPPGRTDTETFISIPIEDPEADLVHSHEWQHIFFKSNIRARTIFASNYSNSLHARLPALNVTSMSEFIHMLVNGLDDIRVCSLWALIYPHSALQVQNRWKRLILESTRYQHDIILFVMGLGLGLEGQMHMSQWIRYRSVLKDAVEKVLLRGFPTCLLAARWIIESILQDITGQYLTPNAYMLKPPEPVKFIPTASPSAGKWGEPPKNVGSMVVATPEEQSKQTETLNKLHHGATKTSHLKGMSWKMTDLGTQPRGKDPDQVATAAMVRMAMGVSAPIQVEKVLEQSQLDIERIIRELRNKTTSLTPSQRLLKGLEDQVEVRTVPASGVDELPLAAADVQLIHTLRHSFIRLMDRKKQITSDSGSTLDPQAYIDFLNGSSNTDIFLEEETARGFSAIILLDMSGSMKEKWEIVARACKVISKAMRFPSARLEVWGFTSVRRDVATMIHFVDTEKGYTGPGVGAVWGLTPLHVALQVSMRRLQGMPGSAQHLIVLTDGYPTLTGTPHHSMSIEGLFAEVSRHIQDGRKRGINVVGLLSGQEVNDEAATIMFGHQRYWTRVSEKHEELFDSLIGLAKKAFVSYLKTS